MRHLLLSSLCCMLALAMITGCSKDEIFPTDKYGGKKSGFLTLTSIPTLHTRTSIGDKSGEVYPVLWGTGDALGLFSATNGVEINNVKASLSEESVGKNKGVFTTLENVDIAEQEITRILIYYPYSSNTELKNGSIESRLDTEQIQSKPSNSNHIGKYGFGHATTEMTAESRSAYFSLNHSMSYLKFIISSNELSSYKLKSVSLYDKNHNTPLSGDFSVNIETGVLTINQSNPYATISVESPEPLSTTQELYLTALPCDLTDKEVYIVVTLTDDNLTTITIPILRNGKKLESNTLNVINIDDLKLSDNSCDWYEPVETRLLVGGWAYGEANSIMTEISPEGINTTISVKARGNFMEVEEPRFAKTIFNCDLNNDHKMVGVNGAKDAITPIFDDYTITINAYSVPGGYPGGTGQVAIYGEDQTIVLWSFIVWMTPTPEEHRYGSTKYVVQDRNFGTYFVADDWKTNGVYFQWGRPTPFGWSAKGYYSKPTEATNVRFSIENPRHLLYTAGVPNSKSDWYLGAWTGTRSDRKDDFWGNPNESGLITNPSDGHKSIYDPCPKGYRVVSPNVLAEVEKNGVYEELSKISVIKYQYDGTNYAYWPLAGARWGSNPADRTAGNANYWSNSPASNYSDEVNHGARTMFYKPSDNTWTYSNGRSHAFSVRCMKDMDNR